MSVLSVLAGLVTVHSVGGAVVGAVLTVASKRVYNWVAKQLAQAKNKEATLKAEIIAELQRAGVASAPAAAPASAPKP